MADNLPSIDSSMLPFHDQYHRGVSVDDTLVRWILAPKDVLDELEHQLKGEIPGRKAGTWLRVGVPLLNDWGVRKMRMIASTYINKVVVLTNFTDEIVKKEMFFLAESLRLDVFNNFEMYGIKSIEDASIIVQTIKEFVFAGLRQSIDGGARSIWSKIQRVNTNIIEDRSKPEKRSYVPGQFTG